MQLSFGMIFSILLIVVFIAFAFFGIKHFLEIQQQASYYQFIEDFKSDVNKAWNEPKYIDTKEYSVPRKVIGICFVNEEENLQILIKDSLSEREAIPNLNLEKILNGQERVCINAKNNQLTLALSKTYGENEVTIKGVN